MANVAEHRVEMPVAPAASKAARAALPEKWLNRFVHFVAVMERLGNALGTLAFTWATVVLLGGYPTVLAQHFYVTTAIIFLEAVRMFSRNNRLDYQLFFRTRGAFRFLGWNSLILLLCFSHLLVFIAYKYKWGDYGIMDILASIILMISPIICSEDAIPTMCNSLHRGISLWGAMVAILFLLPSVLYGDYDYSTQEFSFGISAAHLTVYLVQFLVILLLTVTRLRFPTIIKLVDSAIGSKIILWRPVIMKLCMFTAMLMSAFISHGRLLVSIISSDISALMIASFGNLQIPASVMRIEMALWGLRVLPEYFFIIGEQVVDTKNENTRNLVSTLNIFYGMVLCQGILYIVAGFLEIFSFILRRSLIRCAGLRGPSAVQYVNLYYTYAFNKCMEGAVLVPEKTSLITFAMDSLKSDSPKMQLYGLKMLHSFLKTEPLNTKAKSELTTSTKTVTCLVNMLGWTSEGDKETRSFAAKVTTEIADNLQVVPVPGAMQLIASLLDTVHVQKFKNPLLDLFSPEARHGALVEEVVHDEQTSPMLWLKRMAIYCLLPREEPTNGNEQNSHILGCWKKITKCWSIPEEEPSTDQDILPVQGMLILEKLASFDLESCVEICRSSGLISKVIEFTSNKIDIPNINETHKTLLKGSSLKLLRKLSSIKGKSGVTLRQKISEHPFILSNLAEILDDTGSSQELRELTVELLRNLAMDGNREEISHIRVIISRLMHTFLNQGAPSNAIADSNQSLRIIAGQALALLTTESSRNCLDMLAEPGYSFIKQLTVMIRGDSYKYIASCLLRNMCMHARQELGNSDLKEISDILGEGETLPLFSLRKTFVSQRFKVLEGIMDARGTELEIFIGLSSQICNIIPEDFARELEHGQIKERFIERLVNVLDTNRTPTAHCPGIRRVVVEHAIYMMECKPGYANCFKKYWMMEALLRVERTSRAENYRFFLGDAGLLEHNVPLSELVSRAKELISRE